MGIPSCRFTDRNHEQFSCTVCLDVAEDPIVVNDCEHIFCRKCVDIEGLNKCPSCQEMFKAPKWTNLKGALKRVYLDLKVKCLNSSCDHNMDLSNFDEHDMVCTVGMNLNVEWDKTTDMDLKKKKQLLIAIHDAKSKELSLFETARNIQKKMNNLDSGPWVRRRFSGTKSSRNKYLFGRLKHILFGTYS